MYDDNGDGVDLLIRFPGQRSLLIIETSHFMLGFQAEQKGPI